MTPKPATPLSDEASAAGLAASAGPAVRSADPLDQADPVGMAQPAALHAALSAAPWQHDYYQTLRRIEALHPQLPRLGKARQPRQEPLRIGQDIELDFAPAALSSWHAEAGSVPRLGQRFFGLFGPIGPLPLHLSEYARERQRSHGDATLAAFADVFHHRLGLLFYRAWAEAQPAAQLDRPQDDAFSRRLSALTGLGQPAFQQRESLGDHARLQHSGWLVGATRHAEGLLKILRQYFDVPVHLEQNVGHWLALADDEQAQLQPSSSVRRLVLGRNAALGRKVWDRQSRLRLQFGPLSLAQYLRFQPGAAAEGELRDWLRHYLGLSFSVELRLVLRGADVPRLRLGRCPAVATAAGAVGQTAVPAAGRLGRSAWLGRARPRGRAQLPASPDRADLRLVLDPCPPAGVVLKEPS